MLFHLPGPLWNDSIGKVEFQKHAIICTNACGELPFVITHSD